MTTMKTKLPFMACFFMSVTLKWKSFCHLKRGIESDCKKFQKDKKFEIVGSIIKVIAYLTSHHEDTILDETLILEIPIEMWTIIHSYPFIHGIYSCIYIYIHDFMNWFIYLHLLSEKCNTSINIIEIRDRCFRFLILETNLGHQNLP